MSEIRKFDQEYADWINIISRKFKQSQIKAASRVNEEMLIFYWSLGRDIIQQDAQNKYGSGFYKRLSADLRKALPDVKSFSVTNLHYMAWFFELYPDAIRNLPQVGVDSLEEQNLPQVEAKTGCGIFNIPWGHNKLIIDKCKGDPSKANFFVKETLKNNWSRAVLMNFLDTDLYNRQGTVYERTKPGKISADLFEAFEANDLETAFEYGRNIDFLKKNNAELR